MKKYAVAIANTDYWDNKLEIQIIEADGWKDDLLKHTLFNKPEYAEDHGTSWIPNDMKYAKEDMFESDILFDILEISDK